MIKPVCLQPILSILICQIFCHHSNFTLCWALLVSVWGPYYYALHLSIKSRDLNRPIRSPAAEHSSGSGDLPCNVLPSAFWPHPPSHEGGGDTSSHNFLDRAAARAWGEVQVGTNLWEQRQRDGVFQPAPTLPGEAINFMPAQLYYVYSLF